MHSICIPAVWFLNHFIDYEKLCYSKGAVAEGNGVHQSLREPRVPASTTWLPRGGLGSYKSFCPQKWPELSPCPAAASTIKYPDSHSLEWHCTADPWVPGAAGGCARAPRGVQTEGQLLTLAVLGAGTWAATGGWVHSGSLGAAALAGKYRLSWTGGGTRRTGSVSASAVANFVNLCWTGSF